MIRSAVGLARPGTVDRILAAATALFLIVVLVALARGWADWGSVPSVVWIHLVLILAALALTVPLLLQRRGTRRHRQLGYVWVVAMTVMAAASFAIRDPEHGRLSAIHILSAITLTQAPMVAWHARGHRVEAHRFTVFSIVVGGLLIAGFFTLNPNRALGRWLFG